MATKTINESPLVTDTIHFEIETPGADGCFTNNPYKIDNVTIYYTERDFAGQNYGEYDAIHYNAELLAEVKAADALVCTDPSDLNVLNAQRLRGELVSKAEINKIHFKDAVVIFKAGTAYAPVWMDPDYDTEWDQEKYLLEQAVDENDSPIIGHFTFDWVPDGKTREGDFFICFTWTPNIAGDTLSEHQQFSLLANPQMLTSLPSHITPEGKYEELLERYLPDMYKQYIADNDLTPEVLNQLNLAVAQGFTFLENFANQIIDLFDANVVHESLLVYLANLFNLKLKSSDPTLWRRQIKEAIRLFKKKGTIGGLSQAFSQAGMTLNKLTRLWQVVSPYTWQDSFLVGTSPVFTLTKNLITPIDTDHFELWLRKVGEDEYTQLTKDYVEFNLTECDFNTTMTWIGDELSSGALLLHEGDILRVLYQYEIIPPAKASVEAFIRTLPYGDKRDETAQEYPPKNWNVRLIEEDDPMFSVAIPVRHPFHELLVFGQVRTEFPYSENIYNMEEYNGSTRDSNDVCHIDKSFVDPCGSCLSSKFTVDIGIESLTDDRIVEARDILKEFMPFHAQVQTINYEGEINEFMQTPVETIEILIQHVHTDYTLSGNANPFFTRMLRHGLPNWDVLRDQLATEATVVPEDPDPEPVGTAYNPSIRLFAPNVNLQEAGIKSASHVMKVLSPSPNSGEYTIRDLHNSTAAVATAVDEPLNTALFTFDLLNKNYSTNSALVTQDDLFVFTDAAVDFVALGVKTTWDVDNEPAYTGAAWGLLLTDYSVDKFEVLSIQVDGSLVLYDPSRLLPTSNQTSLDWTLVNDSDVSVSTGETGVLEVTRIGVLDLQDSQIDLNSDLDYFAARGDIVIYGSDEYKIIGVRDGNLVLDGWDQGDASGISIQIQRLLLEGEVGYFNYAGMKLQTTDDYEASLGMVNGQNPPGGDVLDDSHFIENYLVKIDDNYYKIDDIDSTTITLDGLPQEWGTIGSGGTSVYFSILRFTKDTVDIHFTVFDQLDREGKDPIIREIYDSVEETTAITALSSGGGIEEISEQSEEFGIEIVYRDGSIHQGVL